jgi:ribosomal protein S18 acetylase RimI-like enzyme
MPDAHGPAGLAIRRLGVADVAAYRDVMLEAYERHPDAFTSSVAERGALPMAWWQARLDASPAAAAVVLGAFEAQRLAGVVGIEFETREKARHKAALFGMYVPPPFRHRGLGRALVRAALDCIRTRPGVTIVQLTVTDGNGPARALYETCGFTAFGVEPFAVAVGADYVAKVHMWRRLEGTT